MRIWLSLSLMVFMLAAVFKGCDNQALDPAEQPGSFNQAQEELTAENSSQGIVVITVDQAYRIFTENKGQYLFVDVRSEQEFADGHIEGALNIPVSQIEDNLSLFKDKQYIIVYCNGSTCDRSGHAAKILIENKIKPVYDIGGGGIMEWMYKEYPYITESQ